MEVAEAVQVAEAPELARAAALVPVLAGPVQVQVWAMLEATVDTVPNASPPPANEAVIAIGVRAESLRQIAPRRPISGPRRLH